MVSSTYKDLVEHRRAVADALERLGLQLVRMETFGARPDDPSSACLAEIEASELFVGIYAHRYGFVPDSSVVSITESEFDHAVAHRRPTFCFVVDESYTWPGEFIENDPGRAKLRAFKSKVEALVVRDTFTTPEVLASRVASSVGRYLIADPRKHGATSVAQFARICLADAATAVFVDIMRLCCVAGSDTALAANRPRYPEFVDIADEHLSDLRLQISRLDSEAGLDLLQKASGAERSISWLLTRLRRGPSLDRTWPELLSSLHESAERVEALAETANREYYERRVGEVLPILVSVPSPAHGIAFPKSPDEFVAARLGLQSMVIDSMRRSSDFALGTIRDDIDRRLAIPYFAIDSRLLRTAVVG